LKKQDIEMAFAFYEALLAFLDEKTTPKGNVHGILNTL